MECLCLFFKCLRIGETNEKMTEPMFIENLKEFFPNSRIYHIMIHLLTS